MTPTFRALPQIKQDELAFVIDAVRTGFAQATARRTMPALRGAKLLKIVLFGSYARGDWVEDPVGRYFSDYDLLVVVDRDELTDDDYWINTERHLIEALSAGTYLRTPVSLVVHSLDDVNEKLRLGRYFFVDAVRDGIVLFEEPGHPFDRPQPLSPEQALQETRDFFDEWLTTANEFKAGAEFYRERGSSNLAAFSYHQTVERAYHCLFLTLTLYSPKTHQLNKLREMAEDLEPRLRCVWPNVNKFERRAYALLRDAYVKARYSRSYTISDEQLAWLGERAQHLLSEVEAVCRARLTVLEAAA